MLLFEKHAARVVPGSFRNARLVRYLLADGVSAVIEGALRHMKIARRLGQSPRARKLCLTETNCPDIFELTDGRFVIIGDDVTADVKSVLPEDAGIGANERAVVIPREILTAAAPEIPTV